VVVGGISDPKLVSLMVKRLAGALMGSPIPRGFAWKSLREIKRQNSHKIPAKFLMEQGEKHDSI
jgi:hypothetical protein